MALSDNSHRWVLHPSPPTPFPPIPDFYFRLVVSFHDLGGEILQAEGSLHFNIPLFSMLGFTLATTLTSGRYTG